MSVMKIFEIALSHNLLLILVCWVFDHKYSAILIFLHMVFIRGHLDVKKNRLCLTMFSII